MKKNLKIFVAHHDDNALFYCRKKLPLGGFRTLVCLNDEALLKAIVPFSNIDVLISSAFYASGNARTFLEDIRKRKQKPRAKCILIVGADHKTEKWMNIADALIRTEHMAIIPPLLERFYKEADPHEHRVFRRYSRHKALVVDPESNAVDSVIDVSLSGMGFESRFSYEPGLSFRVNVRAWNSRVFQPATGTIVWKDPGKKGYRYGLKFDKVLMPAA
jgi:hypothetical protein